MTVSMADADLAHVRALQAGDDSALDALIERHREPIFCFIHGYVVNDEDAVELTQETFVRAYFNIGKFKPTAKFATWLYRIALNLCRDHAKSRRAKHAAITDSLTTVDGETTVESDLRASGRAPDEEAQSAEKMRALDGAIAQLPHDLRTALVLTVMEQRSHQECAELLETTPKTVETRVYRARKLLAELMSKAGF
jgi:RNA polymerase sigma factor (sigma-70 family)